MCGNVYINRDSDDSEFYSEIMANINLATKIFEDEDKIEVIKFFLESSTTFLNEFNKNIYNNSELIKLCHKFTSTLLAVNFYNYLNDFILLHDAIKNNKPFKIHFQHFEIKLNKIIRLLS